MPLAIYHLIRADFLERTRRYSFLLALGLPILLGYNVIIGRISWDLGAYRGIYNAAWIGGLMALVTSSLLSLIGFYLVKNSIARDIETGVGQIIATTPLSKLGYLLGKTLSNLAVLGCIVAVLALAALVMLLAVGEERQVALWPLLSPFLLITMPVLVFVAALAVLFEVIPWLRGGFGNIVYFVLWLVVMIGGTVGDFLGVQLLQDSATEAVRAVFPDYSGGFRLTLFPTESPQLFRWEGVAWTTDLLLGRLQWVALAALFVGLAALLFQRFDPAAGGYKLLPTRATPPKEPAPAPSAEPAPPPAPVHLTPLPNGPQRFEAWRVLLAELRLMLKGLPWWWYAVMLLLIGAGLANSPESAFGGVLPLAWVWPILIWSSMGTRESHHRTQQLVFSAAHALSRQLPMTWLAGVIVAMIAGSGVLARLLLAGSWEHVGAWMVGALFIPSLALALGTWTGSSKAFEVIYMILWYIGPISREPLFDFMGAVAQTVTTSIPLFYLGYTVVLLALAAFGRSRQLQI